MTRRISRRTAAKLFLSASAVFALPKSAPVHASPKAPPKPALTPAERQKLAKSLVQLRGAVQKIRALKIPMGTEPAFVFRPLPGKR
ncbi:MAG: hypothetical protein ABJC28_01445 [Acidobacteriota bacterium]